MENEKTFMEVVKDAPKSEELVKKKQMDNTPFTIITFEDKNFGTLGKYKITEDYKTVEEVEADLNNITWNKILNLMVIVNEELNKTTKNN